jgi:hypothetical protein
LLLLEPTLRGDDLSACPSARRPRHPRSAPHLPPLPITPRPDPSGASLRTFTIGTTEANVDMTWLYNRMSVNWNSVLGEVCPGSIARQPKTVDRVAEMVLFFTGKPSDW